MRLHDQFEESVDLARTYAEDGAPRTAANVLRKLADKLTMQGEAINSAVRGDPAGSGPFTKEAGMAALADDGFTELHSMSEHGEADRYYYCRPDAPRNQHGFPLVYAMLNQLERGIDVYAIVCVGESKEEGR